MAGDYRSAEIQTDANEVAAEAFARAQSTNPSWAPKPAKAATKIIEAVAAMLAVALGRLANLLDTVAEQVYTLQGTPRRASTAAVAALTVTSNTSSGARVLAAGTTYKLTAADGSYVFAEQIADVTIPDGQTATASGGVQVRVIDADGADGNGYGAGGAVLNSPVYTWFSSSAVVTVTSGGVDEQDTVEYLDYATKRAQRLTDQPIRRGEWADAALTNPLVGRASEIPLYDAGDPGTPNSPLHYTVAVAGTTGGNLTTDQRNGIRDVELATLGGIQVWVVNFNDTTVNAAISYEPRGEPDDAAVEAAWRAFLDRLTYGMPSTGEQPASALLDHVYFRDGIGALEQLDSVERINHLYLSTGGTSPTVEQDVVLAGVAPLPVIGTISVVST